MTWMIPGLTGYELENFTAATTAFALSTATACSVPPPRTAHSVVPSALNFHKTASPPPAWVSATPPNIAGELEKDPAATTAFALSTATPFSVPLLRMTHSVVPSPLSFHNAASPYPTAFNTKL